MLWRITHHSRIPTSNPFRDRNTVLLCETHMLSIYIFHITQDDPNTSDFSYLTQIFPGYCSIISQTSEPQQLWVSALLSTVEEHPVYTEERTFTCSPGQGEDQSSPFLGHFSLASQWQGNISQGQRRTKDTSISWQTGSLCIKSWHQWSYCKETLWCLPASRPGCWNNGLPDIGISLRTSCWKKDEAEA